MNPAQVFLCRRIARVENAIYRPGSTPQIRGRDATEGHGDNAVIGPERAADLVDGELGRVGLASASRAKNNESELWRDFRRPCRPGRAWGHTPRWQSLAPLQALLRPLRDHLREDVLRQVQGLRHNVEVFSWARQLRPECLREMSQATLQFGSDGRCRACKTSVPRLATGAI